MNLLKKRKLARALKTDDLPALLSFLADPEDTEFPAIWRAIQSLIETNPSRIDEQPTYDAISSFRTTADPPYRREALDLMMRSTRPAARALAMQFALGEPGLPEATAGLCYLGRLVESDPDAARSAIAEQAGFTAALLAHVEADAEIGREVGAAIYDLVDLLDLWSDYEFRHAMFKFFCRSRFKDDPRRMEELVRKLDGDQRAELIEPLLMQHGLDPADDRLKALASEIVLSAKGAAVDHIVGIVRDYVATVRRAEGRKKRIGKVAKPPQFYASELALRLVADVAHKSDMRVIVFLKEIADDPSLRNVGLFQKKAHDALEALSRTELS